MVKNIIRDQFFLAQKAVKAGVGDVQVIQDLKDTLKANELRCAGMAANMIGVNKAIIIFHEAQNYTVMCNPVIVEKYLPYPAEEGCLSLDGLRKTTRYKKIVVEYEDEKFRKQKKTFKEWPAQIIQHEVDHLNGIII